MTKLRALFIDIDDTLFSTSEFASLARSNAIDAMIKLGLKMPKHTLIAELNEVVREFSSNYGHHFDKLLVRIPSISYKNINPVILIAGAVIAYHDTKIEQLKPYPDAKEVLHLLAQKTSLILGIISEGKQVKQCEKLLRLGLYKYINPRAIFISDQIGISKPNIKLYLKACEKLRLKPSECMYVGDNPILDIDPAKAIRMHTILLKRSAKHLEVSSKTKPDYEIRNFWELIEILKKKFKIVLDR